MLKDILLKKRLLLILPFFIMLTSCSKSNGNAESSVAVETSANPGPASAEENYENYEDDDDEYDSSNVFSQDSDGGAH